MVLRTAFLAFFLTCLSGLSWATPDRAAFLDIARKGWIYQLRTTMIGRDMSIPVRINGQTLLGASICLVGERPHLETRTSLNAFRTLMAEVTGKPLPMRYAGVSARQCGAGRTVVIRLYSGRPPGSALTDDLMWMNDIHDFGLPQGRQYSAGSPAMAQTFFGRKGQGTHVMVKQPRRAELSEMERDFYRSILIEELFQSFTFGMDILHFDREAAFVSKLEEYPVDLRYLPWDSEPFMEALVRSNPRGLCPFDVFMLHAVADAPVQQTNEDAFLDFIDARYDDLWQRAERVVADGRFQAILDPECRGPFD